MIWILGFAGILLTLLGVWGGPTQKSPRREAEAMARKQPTVSDAWDVLAKPLEEELIKIPEHRPWYTPGSDRRFQQGLLVGLGAGLMVAALTISFAPRQAAPPQVAVKEPPAGAPAANQPAPAQTAQPAPTQPAKPPKPVNQNFTVEPGDLAPDIADKLKAAGLIADPKQFLTRVEERGLDTSLKAGTFVIPTGANLDTVIDVLTA
ncbi:MAG TPA: hypothetical protein VNT01_15165 [Symbiobacteriaceae bacterium]|nr:hypothetical protein [Symbiobacteriaceae bacterium]